MTTEEKAQAYDEAIKRAKEIVSKENVEAAEYIFPELAENEDEKVRKTLIRLFTSNNTEQFGEVTNKQILAWLEKQGEQKPAIFIPKFRVGDKLVSTKNPRLTYEVLEVGHINELGNPEYKVEIFTDGKVSNPRNIHDMECYKVDEWAKLVEQKPADKVEPKFHEGDWISGYYTNYKVLSVNNNGYVVEDVDGSKINILFENEKFHHLFTIADAKAGDVLTCNIGTFIYYKTCPDNIEAYIYYNPKNESIMVENFFKVTLATDHHNCFVHPASKEQRDLLFQKMKEAGYEWDAEKKDLKIIDWSKHIKYEPNGPSIVEEKSAWSEENSCYYDDICEILINLINSPKSKINKDAIQKDLDWLMSIVKSQLKPAWSEEDEDALDIAIRIIQNGGDDCAGILDSDKALKWLKSLKDRVLPQLNQELSDDMTVNEYADLGLPSGTLWKRHNEEKFNDGHDFYTYNEAVQKFGGQLPTKEQFKELKDLCKWTWTGNGYNVTGVNGDSIFLPAAGYSDATGNEYYVEKYGNYWSSIPSGELYAWSLDFNPSWVGMSGEPRGLCQSVRLINSTVH